MALVFQYGSNTSSARLNSDKRLKGSAVSLELVQTVNCFELCFTYQSKSNGCAVADLLEAAGRRIYGDLYEIPQNRIFRNASRGQTTLDNIEGEWSAYYRTTLEVVRVGKSVSETAITYLVKEPSEALQTGADYVKHIID